MDFEAETRASVPAPPAASPSPADAAARLPALRARLYVAAFLVDIIGYGYPVCASAYAQYQLQAEPLTLGLLGTTSTLAYALSCFAFRRLADRTGSMPLIRTSLFLFLLGVFPCALLSRSLAPLFIAAASFGFALSLFWPPLLRQLAHLSPGDVLPRVLGAFNISWALGASAGSWVLPWAQARFDFRPAVALCMASVAGALLITWFQSPPVAAPPARTGAGANVPRAELFLWIGWIANFCVGLAAGGLHYVMVYVGKGLSFDLTILAWILFAKEIGRTLTFAGLRAWHGWHYSLGWLAAAQLAGAGALLLCGFTGSAALFFVLFLGFGIFCGLGYYSSVFYSLNLGSDHGAKSSLHEAVLASGLVLGPISCGLMGWAFPRWPGGVPCLAGVLILAGLAVECVLYARHSGARRGSSVDSAGGA